MRYAPTVAVLAGLLLMGASELEAQNPNNRSALERRVRAAFVQRAQRQLALTDSEVGALRETLAWSDGQRRAIAVENQDLNRRSQALSLDGNVGEAQAILDARVRLQEREATLFREEQERLLDVLTPPELVRFYRLRAELNRRILQLRQQRPGNP